MNKNPKLIIRNIIAKSGKILRRKTKQEMLVNFDETLKKGKRFSRLKRIGEKIRNSGKNKSKGKKKEMKIAKAWNRNFQGSFDHTVRKTAEFIKKKRNNSSRPR